ncbi:MAG: flagellar hook assembly protein FlgD [Deltaproteobacteria bacterium]|nr:flagellar hook assembly protein FlgD [Deltaproteobacteria bacterium]
MSTNAISNYESLLGQTGTTSSSQTATKTVGKDEFMKLLLAQLKNQDPLNPMDGTDFAAQLAQFSSLEQLTNLNTTLETQSVNQMTLGYAQSVNMIGKEVVANAGNTITATGQTASLNYQLASDAQSVTITILDKNGRLVKTWDESAKSAGMNHTTWDCSGVERGDYTYQVTAKDSFSSAVTAQTLTTGVVSAVHFRSNQILVTVNGREVPLSNIIEIKTPENG